MTHSIDLRKYGLALCSLLLVMASACSPELMVDVRVTGLDPAVQVLELRAKLDGHAAHEADRQVSGQLDTFLVRLPANTRGQLELFVGGQPEDGCNIVEGSAKVDIDSDRVYAVTIDLTPPATPSCQLVIDLVGPAAGRVASLRPVGTELNCTKGCSAPGRTEKTCCRARFRKGTAVELLAVPGDTSYFSNWAGACSGRESCTINIASSQTVVKANFIDPPICSGGNWCWDHPQPVGSNLRAIKAFAPNNVWAVGDGGLVLHWDGIRWQRLSTGRDEQLNAIWGASPNNIFIGGYSPWLFRWTGADWEPFPSAAEAIGLWSNSENNVWMIGEFGGVYETTHSGNFTTTDHSPMPMFIFSAIWGSAINDIWLSAGTSFYHWDGAALTELPITGNHSTTGLIGFARNDVWSVGDVVMRWNGSQWSVFDAKISGSLIAGSSSSDVWVGDNAGALQHWNGSAWKEYRLDGVWINSISSSGPKDAWLVSDKGKILHWDGTDWREASMGSRSLFHAIWGTGPNNVWAVGHDGAATRWDGIRWSDVDIDNTRGYSFLGGTGPNDIWAGGSKDVAHHWDGVKWSPVPMNAPGTLFGFFIVSANDAWAVGDEGAIMHWDGSAWSISLHTKGRELYSIWGSDFRHVWAVGAAAQIWFWDGSRWKSVSPFSELGTFYYSVYGFGQNDVWAVGALDRIVHWNGQAWSRVPVGVLNVLPGDRAFTGVWGSSSNDLWVVGPRGTMLRGYGGVLSPVPTGTFSQLFSVWGAGPNDIWAVGENGTILRYRP